MSRYNSSTDNPAIFNMTKPVSDRAAGERVTLMTPDDSQPEHTPMASPAIDTNTASTSATNTITQDTAITASTLEELLWLGSYTPADIMTCRIKKVLVKVVKDSAHQCWKITEDDANGKSVFRLVALEKKQSDRIIRITREKDAQKKRAQEGDDAKAGEATAATGKGKAAATINLDYIVDRPGDPGYRDWVLKMVKPRVQGSALLGSEPPAEAGDTCPFWWMPEWWKKGYMEDTSLLRMAKHQAAVSGALS